MLADCGRIRPLYLDNIETSRTPPADRGGYFYLPHYAAKAHCRWADL